MANTRSRDISGDNLDSNLNISRRRVSRDEDEKRQDNQKINPTFPKRDGPQTWDGQPSSEQNRLARDPKAPIRPEEDRWDTSDRKRRMQNDQQSKEKQTDAQNISAFDKDLDDVRRATSYEGYEKQSGPPVDAKQPNGPVSSDERRDQIRRGHRAIDDSISGFEGGGKKHQGRF